MMLVEELKSHQIEAELIELGGYCYCDSDFVEIVGTSMRIRPSLNNMISLYYSMLGGRSMERRVHKKYDLMNPKSITELIDDIKAKLLIEVD